MIIFPIYGTIKHVPNHQPDKNCIATPCFSIIIPFETQKLRLAHDKTGERSVP
jgi:hypothetical protein